MNSQLISINSETISLPSVENRARIRRQRVIFKNGNCNISKSMDIQWRWTYLIFVSTYIASWLFYGLIWWLIVYTHGDLEEENSPPFRTGNNWTPCINNVYNWTSCFLFSVETQTSIGFGLRVITEECPEAIFIICCQAVTHLGMHGFMGGLVFAKMVKPKTITLLFSRNAVICLRDGVLCLMFRVGDMRLSEIIGSTIQAKFVRPKRTADGEIFSNYCKELDVGVDDCGNNLFFIWPLIVVHKIDEDSPLYKMSPADILKDNFEILVLLEATVHSTGQSMQARCSYLSKEILWGYAFEQIIHFNRKKSRYEVNCEKFDDTYPIETPPLSAGDLKRFQEDNSHPTEPIRPTSEYEDLTSSFL